MHISYQNFHNRLIACKIERYLVYFSIFVACLLTVFDTAQGQSIDIYPGDSFEKFAENLNPGDVLIIHQGIYLDTGRISITVKGTSNNPIIIKGADNEAHPLISRSSSSSVQNTLNIEGASYLTIKGLEITGNGGDGINLNGNPSYITIEDLVIHEVDVGINFRSNMHDVIVRRNHIYNTGINSGTGEGMYVGCNNATCIVSDSVIENNWIHDTLPGTTQGDGIEIKVGSHSNLVKDNVIYNMNYPGIFVYGTGENPANVVERNVVWNCLEGIYAVADAVVRNNIIMNSGTGLSLYSHSQVSQMKNVQVVNNTIYNCNDGIYVRWGGTNMSLVNNAVFCPGKTAVNSSYGVNGYVRSNYVEGNMNGDAIDNSRFFSGGSYLNAFVDVSKNDLWPKAGSTLIGNAQAEFVPQNDYIGNIRTNPFDIGAYESNDLSSNPGWIPQAGFKELSINSRTPPDAPENLRVVR